MPYIKKIVVKEKITPIEEHETLPESSASINLLKDNVMQLTVNKAGIYTTSIFTLDGKMLFNLV